MLIEAGKKYATQKGATVVVKKIAVMYSVICQEWKTVVYYKVDTQKMEDVVVTTFQDWLTDGTLKEVQ